MSKGRDIVYRVHLSVTVELAGSVKTPPAHVKGVGTIKYDV